MVQYQHFIPQFLLRNFSHPYKSPPGQRSKKKGKARAEKGMYPGDKVLNVIDITTNEPQIHEVPVRKWFGQDDMYNDATDTIRSKKDVEKELSKLESSTAEILRKVQKAHENNDPGVSLTRVERNKLRKFLFIMKYRGPNFFKKYAFENETAYDAEDKNLVTAYMAETGMERPRDVWLHNLRTILDLEMDAELKWMDQIPKLMFPGDAEMFKFHCQSSYTAFCTPAEKDDEFLLTEQCYNLTEGPFSDTFNTKTGEYMGNTYLCYHEFAPVSPRLIIVLRSCVLPEALQDMNPRVREERRMMQQVAAEQFPDPGNIKSLLHDLPVAMPRNSYSRVIDDMIESNPETSGFRPADKFCFRFWPINTKHVNIINSIYLDNLAHCKSIVFASIAPFKKTLEAYMAGSIPGFKAINVDVYGAEISRLACLERLATLLKQLGSTVMPVWSPLDVKKNNPIVMSLDDVWLRMMKRVFESGDEPIQPDASIFWNAYHKLGGSRKTISEDLDQSWRLYKLTALVHNSTVDLNQNLRQRASFNMHQFIIERLHRRIWLFVKHQRWMLSSEYAMHQKTYIGTAPLYAAKTQAFFGPGPEDDVVLNKHHINRDQLSFLILFAEMMPT